MLEDGTYDAIVVDAAEISAGEATDEPSLRIELTVLAGLHKGEVIALTGAARGRDPLDLLATPATIVVTDGVPRLCLEG